MQTIKIINAALLLVNGPPLKHHVCGVNWSCQVTDRPSWRGFCRGGLELTPHIQYILYCTYIHTYIDRVTYDALMSRTVNVCRDAPLVNFKSIRFDSIRFFKRRKARRKSEGVGYNLLQPHHLHHPLQPPGRPDVTTPCRHLTLRTAPLHTQSLLDAATAEGVATSRHCAGLLHGVRAHAALCSCLHC